MVEVATPEMIRVVRNLLDNAVRHTDPGGEVVLRASAIDPPGVVTVSVTDGCGGIPSSEIGRVFETGYRGDQARSPSAGKGGGLGLAVAHGLVAAHAGQIIVTNERGGCRFTISLPASSHTN